MNLFDLRNLYAVMTNIFQKNIAKVISRDFTFTKLQLLTPGQIRAPKGNNSNALY